MIKCQYLNIHTSIRKRPTLAILLINQPSIVKILKFNLNYFVNYSGNKCYKTSLKMCPL